MRDEKSLVRDTNASNAQMQSGKQGKTRTHSLTGILPASRILRTRYLAACLPLNLAGNEQPSADDIKSVLSKGKQQRNDKNEVSKWFNQEIKCDSGKELRERTRK